MIKRKPMFLSERRVDWRIYLIIGIALIILIQVAR